MTITATPRVDADYLRYVALAIKRNLWTASAGTRFSLATRTDCLTHELRSMYTHGIDCSFRHRLEKGASGASSCHGRAMSG